MKLIANFDFKAAPTVLGTDVQVGMDPHYQLNGKDHMYDCAFNEMLIVKSMNVIGDDITLCKISEVYLLAGDSMATGVVSKFAVLPEETLTVGIKFKRRDEFEIPLESAVITRPVEVELTCTRYRVNDIEAVE